MLEKILEKRAMIITILFAVLIGGIISYQRIGKLEDAEIPIKTAMVVTAYPGASAHEVELEVTHVLEQAINKLENIKTIESISRPGISMIEVNILDKVRTEKLPQIWDHLRRKVSDAEGSLPANAYAPIVNDDFADTYGILWAVTGDEGYDLDELLDYTEYIEKNITAINGVRRSQIFGKQMKTIEVVFSPEKLAQLSINPMYIAMAVQNEGEIVNPGNIRIDKDAIRLGVGNKIGSTKEIEDLLVSTPEGNNFRLGDIAEVKTSYMQPKQESFYFNGRRGFALGFSNEKGVNVVEVGAEMKQRLEELKENLPLGIEIGEVYNQADRVKVAVDDFMWNLVTSVAIVIIVLLFAMGFRSGLLISSGLVFTILGTIIVMFAIDLPLHRITLASIILSMGMLVDNAIVVADGILTNLKKGVDRKIAFISPAQKTAWPLLGATAIAILAFLPLGMAPSVVGEFLNALFIVLAISLTLSWVFAMIQTPFMGKLMLGHIKKEDVKEEESEAEKKDKPFKRFLVFSLKHKKLTLLSGVATLVIALYCFQFMQVDFMPPNNYDQFVIQYQLPQGSDIEAVEEDLLVIDKHVRTLDEVKTVSLSTGRPPARYNLMRLQSLGGTNYGELIIEVNEKDQVAPLLPLLEEYIAKSFPEAKIRVLEYGSPFAEFDVEAQFTGPDPAILRDLNQQAIDILNSEPMTKSTFTNWENKAKVVQPVYSVERAQRLGLTRKDMANSIQIANNGMPIGAIYEGTQQIPVLMRTNALLSEDLSAIENVPVWGQRAITSTPIKQISEDLVLTYEDQSIHRYNGARAIRAQADAKLGYTADDLQLAVQDKIEAISLPDGYSFKWEGSRSTSEESNGSLLLFFPLAVGLMLIITIALFNNFRQPIIIFSIVPFALIGIVFGFIVTGAYFNFLSIIGTLGLMGMMIKNCIVLLDEIDINIKEGMSPYNATVESTLSRVRPVMMASLTTILGMLPLLADSMFQSMAITIMFGLLFGSLITLVIVPSFYAVMFRVKTSKSAEKSIIINEK